ncbi:TaqI-like C-terminal specificity domain-containing protein, partial [Spirosoma gilvum]
APAPIKHQVDCLRLLPAFKKDIIGNKSTLEQAESELLHQVPQSRFTANTNYIFDIDLSVNDQRTFEKIQQTSIPLHRIVLNTRGAEISKKGLASQCPKCEHWFPYPKTNQPSCPHCQARIDPQSAISDRIVLNHNGVGNLKLKVGEDLYRYTSISKSWINTNRPGINYKSLSIYQGDKILVRKTGVGITASIDYDNALTNQVVYILKLKPAFQPIITLELVLAVLNSRAMTYFLIKKFGENEWKSHPYLTQRMLIDLPFPKEAIETEWMKPIINQITTLIRAEVADSTQRNITKETDILIEQMIARCFGLDRYDYVAIFEALNAAEPLIPIKRLLNCTVNDIFPQ